MMAFCFPGGWQWLWRPAVKVCCFTSCEGTVAWHVVVLLHPNHVGFFVCCFLCWKCYHCCPPILPFREACSFNDLVETSGRCSSSSITTSSSRCTTWKEVLLMLLLLLLLLLYFMARIGKLCNGRQISRSVQFFLYFWLLMNRTAHMLKSGAVRHSAQRQSGSSHSPRWSRL